jgi:hypothetical protein
MAVHFGKIDTYFCNVMCPKNYAGKRLMNVNGSFGKGILWFMPEGSALPDNRKRGGQNVFDVYYHTADWAALVDLLRNEGPVHFNFNDSSNAAQIYTGQEPVGEGEI